MCEGMLALDPHPLLDLRAFVTTFPRPLGEVPAAPELLALLALDAQAPMQADDGVREAVGPVIEAAREASLPEYEAMAIANRAWVAWRSGDEEMAAADAQAALDMWVGLPTRYMFDWMALWPLVAIALASQQIEQAAEYARGILTPPQQLLQEPARTLAEDAVRARDTGQLAQAEELLRRAVRAAGDLGYL